MTLKQLQGFQLWSLYQPLKSPMSDCGCHSPATSDPVQRRTLIIALALNAAMALIGAIAGWIAYSAGLLADALDMASDAIAYAIGLTAVDRSMHFKQNAARISALRFASIRRQRPNAGTSRAAACGFSLSAAMIVSARKA